MGLNYQLVASTMSDEYDSIKQTPDVPAAPRWMDAYKSAYDGDANNGTFSLPAVVMTSNPSLLEFNVSNSVSTAQEMAKSLADYWSYQVTPGTPQNCTAITSVTNDASKIETPILNYLTSLGNTERLPQYEHLFQFIEDQVKTIIWTVNEADGTGCSTSYTVSIS
jgi:hypothetical protein